MPFTHTTSPRTQYNRNLTFTLTGGGSSVVFTFPIKPGEFERLHPARVTTTQTLQGVFQDMGGLGVQTLRIQGNTGWRRRANGAHNNGMDGFESFQMLYNKIYVEYHRRISSAADVNSIKLLLIDDIYDIVYNISMDDFQATKSKTNPLLYNYTILMTVQKTGVNGRAPKDLRELGSVTLDPEQIPIWMADVLNTADTYKSENLRTYTVLKGDDLISIAFKFYGIKGVLRDTEIASLNGIAPPYAVSVGTVLKIPW